MKRTGGVTVILLFSFSFVLDLNAATDFPIDQPVVTQLSSYLKSQECHQLCLFLARESSNPVTSGRKLNCPNAGKSSIHLTFVCISSLRKWNEELLLEQAGNMLDLASYAEDLLEVGLKDSSRPDLASWIKKQFYQKHHLENLGLKRNFANHVKAGKKEEVKEMLADGEIELSSSSTTETENELDEDDLIFYLQLIIGGSVLLIVIVIIAVIIAWKRKPNRKVPRELKPRMKYNYTTTTETETDESEAGESTTLV